jgi:hypothetical protein
MPLRADATDGREGFGVIRAAAFTDGMGERLAGHPVRMSLAHPAAPLPHSRRCTH